MRELPSSRGRARAHRRAASSASSASAAISEPARQPRFSPPSVSLPPTGVDAGGVGARCNSMTSLAIVACSRSPDVCACEEKNRCVGNSKRTEDASVGVSAPPDVFYNESDARKIMPSSVKDFGEGSVAARPPQRWRPQAASRHRMQFWTYSTGLALIFHS